MAKYVGYKRPKNTKKAMKNLLRYLGYHKWLLLLVAVLVAISSGVSIAGTYLIRPVINDYAIPGDIPGLIRMMLAMGILYLCGVCATFAYNRLMVHTSQQVVTEIRRDLFAHIQKLPLAYFDAHTHGELMSRFTNDVDTVQEALNGTFSMLIQSFLILTGTLSMLFVLSARLTLIVLLFLAASGFFIWYNGKRSKKYFNAQQEALAAVNGFVEEMTAGQKVEKVFNHEKQDLEEFLVRNASQSLYQRPDLVRYAGSGQCQHVLLQLWSFCGSRRYICTDRTHGSWNPCLLSGLCASERDALKSVYKPVQLSSGGSLRCRADF